MFSQLFWEFYLTFFTLQIVMRYQNIILQASWISITMLDFLSAQFFMLRFAWQAEMNTASDESNHRLIPSCCWATVLRLNTFCVKQITCPLSTFLFPISHSAACPLILRLLPANITSPHRVHNDKDTKTAAKSNTTSIFKFMRIIPTATSCDKNGLLTYLQVGVHIP